MQPVLGLGPGTGQAVDLPPDIAQRQPDLIGRCPQRGLDAFTVFRQQGGIDPVGLAPGQLQFSEVVEAFGIDSIWFGVLIAMNLQASFLTPPFGLSLFFLKGAAGNSVTTMQIYKGIIPFILLQLLGLGLVILFPDLVFAFI